MEMSTWGLVDTINTVSICFLSLFSVFLLTHKRGKPVSNKTLGFFLLATALTLLNFVLSRPSLLSSSFLLVFLFMNSVDFLIGPLLYFYVRTVAYRDFVWRKKYLLHAIPMIVYLVFLAVVCITTPATLRNVDKMNESFLVTFGLSAATAIVAAQLLAYLGSSLFVLRSYHRRISDSYSSLDKLSLSWLYSILGGFGLSWLIGAAHGIAAISTQRGAPSLVLSIVDMLITFGIALIILLRGLKQPEIFSGIEEKPKYEHSQLTKDESDRVLDELNVFMETQKPFLIPRLSVGELAKNMGVTARTLSQVINSRLGKNFLDFINSYRVEEAKKLITASGSNGRTILEIALESGFNSKSVFNKAFRKHAGVTPKDFKKKYRSAPYGPD